MDARAKTSDPCRNLASCTTPSRPISTCKVTLPRCRDALADAGYSGSTGWVSIPRSSDSGTLTGSIDDMAVSIGLAPLDCGVEDAIWDFRLEGMPAATLAETT